MLLTKPSSNSLTEYAETLWNNAFRLYRVIDEYVLQGIFWRIVGIDPSQYAFILGIGKKHYHTWSRRHVTSITKLQHGLLNTDGHCCREKIDNRLGYSGRRGNNVNKTNLKSSSLIKFSSRKASSCRSEALPNTMSIWQKSRNTPCNRIRSQGQQHQSKTHPSSGSVWQATSQSCNVRPSSLSFTSHSSMRSKPTFLVVRTARRVPL